MNFAKFTAIFAASAMLFACGEVDGGFDDIAHPSSSSSSKILEVSSSSSSDCSPIDIDISWQTPHSSSYTHGTTSITLSPFMISAFLITQGQYKAIMGENPSRIKDDNFPVEGASWFKAVEFSRKLSEQMCLGSNAIRLPTEAEWEYSAYPLTPVIQRDYEYWEWTNDCFDSDFPYNGITVNPSGPPNCLPNNPKVRKGLGNTYDSRFSTDPNCGLECGPISFRVVKKQ